MNINYVFNPQTVVYSDNKSNESNVGDEPVGNNNNNSRWFPGIKNKNEIDELRHSGIPNNNDKNEIEELRHIDLHIDMPSNNYKNETKEWQNIDIQSNSYKKETDKSPKIPEKKILLFNKPPELEIGGELDLIRRGVNSVINYFTGRSYDPYGLLRSSSTEQHNLFKDWVFILENFENTDLFSIATKLRHNIESNPSDFIQNKHIEKDLRLFLKSYNRALNSHMNNPSQLLNTLTYMLVCIITTVTVSMIFLLVKKLIIDVEQSKEQSNLTNEISELRSQNSILTNDNLNLNKSLTASMDNCSKVYDNYTTLLSTVVNMTKNISDITNVLLLCSSTLDVCNQNNTNLDNDLIRARAGISDWNTDYITAQSQSQLQLQRLNTSLSTCNANYQHQQDINNDNLQQQTQYNNMIQGLKQNITDTYGNITAVVDYVNRLKTTGLNWDGRIPFSFPASLTAGVTELTQQITLIIHDLAQFLANKCA